MTPRAPGAGRLASGGVDVDPGGLVLAGTFTVLWLACPLLLAAVGVGLARLVLDARGDAAGDALALATSPGFMAALLPAQFALMLALLPVTATLVDRHWYASHDGAAVPRGWRALLALTPPAAPVAALAVGIGLVVGWAPGWIAEQLLEAYPISDGGTLAQVAEAMAQGGAVSKALLVVEIGLLAPVAEELVFRGFLWDALARRWGAQGAWAVTSVLFAAYHLDPVHATAVLFTGFVLGALRGLTGSVWPGVVAHAVNNSVAMVALWRLPPGAAETSTPPAQALAGVLLSIVGCGAVAWWTGARDRRPAS
ncbi:MAG: CPBP family intramembrane metalloprotease [Alphaproteobacteria bacterium]|nr:CPBP family intramembrane metalloprotease [Alphaproteobacteria bacterium]